MVESWLFAALVERQLELWQPVGAVRLHHAAQDTSKLRGLKNGNCRHWQQQYPRVQLQLIPDGRQRDQLCLEYGEQCCLLDKKALRGL